jgi:hypothetical protein
MLPGTGLPLPPSFPNHLDCSLKLRSDFDADPGALDLRPSPSGPAGHWQHGSSTRETSEEQDHHFRLCTREF